MTQPSRGVWARVCRSLPPLDEIDRSIYRTIPFGFPLLTMVIITGAVWAQYVWQRWWSWDPKETASLVTWLVYAAYLHGRKQRNWGGGASAGFAVLGLAAVLFTYAGVNYLQSLHSYGLAHASPEGRLFGGFSGVSTAEALLTTAAFVLFLVAFALSAGNLARGVAGSSKTAQTAALAGLLALSVVLVMRMVDAGRITFTSGYDFSLWFVWGIVLCALVASFRGQGLALTAGLPLALLIAMYGYLYFPHKGHTALPPALQNKLWLHIHVSLAIFAYGALALAAGWGILYWIRQVAERRVGEAQVAETDTPTNTNG